MTKTPLIFKVVSLYVAIAGQLWLASYFIDQAQPVAATQAVYHQPDLTEVLPQEIISGQPDRLHITRLGVDLSIREGSYDVANDEWTLSDDAAYFATITALPNNQQGNTFIYGHNTTAVLEPVKNIISGDLLTISTQNGRTFTYAYVDDMSVTPDQTTVLDPASEKPKVTLMTCEGIFSQTRRIMRFEFVGVS